MLRRTRVGRGLRRLSGSRHWVPVVFVFVALTAVLGHRGVGDAEVLYGFTAYPYDATFEAVDRVHEIILPNSNLYAIHGIDAEGCLPWEEMLAGLPLPDSIQSNWADVKARIPSTHAVYLAVTATDMDRRYVISACGADGRRDPSAGPWRDRLDHPDVLQAYATYVRRLVAFFQPRYLNIGIEMSELSLGHPEEWPSFEALFTHVYDTVKAEYPAVQIAMELVLQSLLLPRVAEQVRSLVDRSDYLCLSFYPYGSPWGVWYGAPPLPEGDDQWRQPLTWVRQYTTKPIAICETGYTSAPVNFPELSLTLDGDTTRQTAFLRDLVAFATQDQYAFVVWFVPVDYDRLYAGLPTDYDWLRIWMWTGLFDKDLNPKPAWSIWQATLGDTVAPATTIVAGPTGTVPLNSASFTWTGSDDRTPAGSLVYAFRLYPLERRFSAFGRATRRSYAGLPNGRTYTFYVKARDLAGHEDQTPAARSFTVATDTVAPATTIVAGPTGTVPLNSASFTWTGSDDRTPAGSLVYAFRLYPLERRFSAFGRATRRSYAGLPNGRTYTFYVKARDLAGREDQTPAARRFTVSVPTTTVRAGADR